MATRKTKKSAKAKSTKKAPVKETAKPAMKTAAKKTRAEASAVVDWNKRFHPLQDRIVVIEIKESTTTPSGLLLPETSQEGPSRGKVVAVGTGHVNKKGRLRPLDVRVGDTVLVSSHAGTRVTVDSNDAWIVREDDVLGIVP